MLLLTDGQTDGQTDRQTDIWTYIALCYVSRHEFPQKFENVFLGPPQA